MDLMPWKSSKEGGALDSLRREFHQLFDRFWSGQLEPMQLGRWVPAVDVVEKDDSVVVQAEVPGIDPENIDVSIEGDVLTIRGEKKDVREEKGENYHRVERQYGSFARSVALPSEIVADKVEATFRNGVLEVVLPKSEQARPKRVSINVQP